MPGYEELNAKINRLKREGGAGWIERKSVVVSGIDGVTAPFDELIGLEVVDYCPGRMFLSVPAEQPSKTGILLSAGSFEISYGDYNKMLSKPCLLVSNFTALALRCPMFFKDESKYQALIYAFEEVTDTMGLGLTFAKGWHAVNTSTFANEPFDPETYLLKEDLTTVERNATAGNKEYLKGMFRLRERIAFTVADENIQSYGEVTMVGYVDIQTVEVVGAYYSFYVRQGSMERAIGGSATITYETIHPISDKYLPGVCLPVVELETAVDLTTDFTTLSSADTEAIKDAVAKYQYAMFIVKVGAAAVPVICNRVNEGYFIGSFAQYLLAILLSENGNAMFMRESVG